MDRNLPDSDRTVSNPPPSPVTDDPDHSEHHQQQQQQQNLQEQQQQVQLHTNSSSGQRRIQSYNDDFLDIGLDVDSMEVFWTPIEWGSKFTPTDISEFKNNAFRNNERWVTRYFCLQILFFIFTKLFKRQNNLIEIKLKIFENSLIFEIEQFGKFYHFPNYRFIAIREIGYFSEFL